MFSDCQPGEHLGNVVRLRVATHLITNPVHLRLSNLLRKVRENRRLDGAGPNIVNLDSALPPAAAGTTVVVTYRSFSLKSHMSFTGYTVDNFPDATFTSKTAADLGVASTSVAITSKTATSRRRRRSMLAAGVRADYEVSDVAQAFSDASTIGSQTTSAGTFTSLAAAMGSSPTVSTTAPTYGIRLEMQATGTDAAAVA